MRPTTGMHMAQSFSPIWSELELEFFRLTNQHVHIFISFLEFDYENKYGSENLVTRKLSLVFMSRRKRRWRRRRARCLSVVIVGVVIRESKNRSSQSIYYPTEMDFTPETEPEENQEIDQYGRELLLMFFSTYKKGNDFKLNCIIV